MKKLLLTLSLLSGLNLYLAAQNWHLLNSSLNDDLNTVYISAQGTIFLGSDLGNIFMMDTSGSVNLSQTPAGIDGISDITFRSTNEGWAVGDDGLILYSIDGGLSWTTISSGVNSDLNSIFFADSNTAFIAGRDGTILKSSNGGMSWISQSSGTLNRLEDIWFVSASHGFVAGRDGSFLSTTDGGSNWSQQNLGTGDNKSLFFLNDSTGFTAGENGIFKTTNGGMSWINVKDTTFGEINALYFADNLNGYVLGELGVIGKSGDGGNNWITDTVISTLINIEMNDVYFLNPSLGIAVGDSGTVLLYGQGVIGNPVQANAAFYLDYAQSGGTNLYLYNISTPSPTDPNFTVSYLWNFGDGDTSHQPFPVHVYNSFGSYVICLTVTAIDSMNNTSTDTFCDTLGIDSSGNVLYKKGIAGFTLNVLDPAALGVDDKNLSTYNIFPNPANDFISFSTGNNGETQRISVYSPNGRKLLSANKRPEEKLFIDELSPGVYIVILETSDNEVFRYKLLKN